MPRGPGNDGIEGEGLEPPLVAVVPETGRRWDHSGETPTTEVVDMCHERWMRRQRRREERFDEELRYLFDDVERPEPPAPVVEHDRDEGPAPEERPLVEAGGRD
jgi:hypothetical protein